MSGEFLWELEKLRRRFSVDAEELRLATRELTRKPRGLKEQRHTGEISLARKQRRASREFEYFGMPDRSAERSDIAEQCHSHHTHFPPPARRGRDALIPSAAAAAACVSQRGARGRGDKASR
jgi:hypothetical protein